MELRELYDEHRNKLGKLIKKGDKPLPGEHYLVVFIIIKNKTDGSFLIQKRSKDKGGKWACTAGHPKAGETSFEGLLTEVKEELGIDLKNEKTIRYDTIVDDCHIYDYYYTEMDIKLNELTLQKEELTDVKLVNLHEIQKMIKKGDFEKNHCLCVKKFVDIYPMIKNKYDCLST